MDGEQNLEHWNEAERTELRKRVSDLVLKEMTDTKTLNAREVMFEAYLALIWLSADISPFTYKDFLEYVADLNNRYLGQLEQQMEDMRAQMAAEEES